MGGKPGVEKEPTTHSCHGKLSTRVGNRLPKGRRTLDTMVGGGGGGERHWESKFCQGGFRGDQVLIKKQTGKTRATTSVIQRKREENNTTPKVRLFRGKGVCLGTKSLLNQGIKKTVSGRKWGGDPTILPSDRWGCLRRRCGETRGQQGCADSGGPIKGSKKT